MITLDTLEKVFLTLYIGVLCKSIFSGQLKLVWIS